MDIKKYKIMFIDLDGTLLNKKSCITEYTKNTIKHMVDKRYVCYTLFW